MYLVHYEYRVYSPRLGRRLSRDPIGEAGGRNLYAFAGNDPVNSQDVLGLFSWFGRSGPQEGSPGGNMGPSDGGRMESLMRSFVKFACSAVDGFFKGFDETVEMLRVNRVSPVLDATPLSSPAGWRTPLSGTQRRPHWVEPRPSL